MKKILFVTGCMLTAFFVFGQTGQSATKKSLANRPNDHILLQFGYHGWNNIPDSINQQGLSKTFNAYFMFDFPFKNKPNLSIGVGAGIASDHLLFKATHVGIKENASIFVFTDLSDTNHFKKTKLATVFLEAPIELRYSANPYTGKGWKFAAGVKVGTLINAHTRNVEWRSSSGTVINDYVMKENSTKFFNKTRVSGMLRVGYGHLSLFGSYQLNGLIKEGFGPDVRPFSIGITLSGL